MSMSPEQAMQRQVWDVVEGVTRIANELSERITELEARIARLEAAE